MLKNQLQPILNFFFADSTERKESRSSQASMLKNQLVQQSHLQPIIHYFNEQAHERATESNLSQRSEPSRQPDWLRRLWQAMIADTDPQIRQRLDQSGQMYWQVYDPVTDKHGMFLSEDEVYQWLESRYYQ